MIGSEVPREHSSVVNPPSEVGQPGAGTSVDVTQNVTDLTERTADVSPLSSPPDDSPVSQFGPLFTRRTIKDLLAANAEQAEDKALAKALRGGEIAEGTDGSSLGNVRLAAEKYASMVLAAQREGEGTQVDLSAIDGHVHLDHGIRDTAIRDAKDPEIKIDQDRIFAMLGIKPGAEGEAVAVPEEDQKMVWVDGRLVPLVSYERHSLNGLPIDIVTRTEKVGLAGFVDGVKSDTLTVQRFTDGQPDLELVPDPALPEAATTSVEPSGKDAGETVTGTEKPAEKALAPAAEPEAVTTESTKPEEVSAGAPEVAVEPAASSEPTEPVAAPEPPTSEPEVALAEPAAEVKREEAAASTESAEQPVKAAAPEKTPKPIVEAEPEPVRPEAVVPAEPTEPVVEKPVPQEEPAPEPSKVEVSEPVVDIKPEEKMPATEQPVELAVPEEKAESVVESDPELVKTDAAEPKVENPVSAEAPTPAPEKMPVDASHTDVDTGTRLAGEDEGVATDVSDKLPAVVVTPVEIIMPDATRTTTPRVEDDSPTELPRSAWVMPADIDPSTDHDPVVAELPRVEIVSPDAQPVRAASAAVEQMGEPSAPAEETPSPTGDAEVIFTSGTQDISSEVFPPKHVGADIGDSLAGGGGTSADTMPVGSAASTNGVDIDPSQSGASANGADTVDTGSTTNSGSLDTNANTNSNSGLDDPDRPKPQPHY